MSYKSSRKEMPAPVLFACLLGITLFVPGLAVIVAAFAAYRSPHRMDGLAAFTVAMCVYGSILGYNQLGADGGKLGFSVWARIFLSLLSLLFGQFVGIMLVLYGRNSMNNKTLNELAGPIAIGLLGLFVSMAAIKVGSLEYQLVAKAPIVSEASTTSKSDNIPY
jgi:uncharacterized membrane protein HdeD (DUF308 family)